ncbi:MAG: RNase adapter RapZ [Actinobacteria bacterium]|nr:RNase adapter RapZ [Actinomycetota bacterium]MCL5888133.1 RNase adapter RapZ [Actinomycetota bacterium]
MSGTCESSVEDRDAAETSTELVVITGMSGAGRTEAIHTFEDMGYFCIDNIPPGFISQVVALMALPGSRIQRMALVCDVRSQEFFDELLGELKNLDDGGIAYELLFLDADDDTLVRRFKETRRRHPLCSASGSVLEGIIAERKILGEVRARADVILDSSTLKPAELRAAIKQRFSTSSAPSLTVTVSSFGFKYGISIDADIVMDVRFLPNPYYLPGLRELTGLDPDVRAFVLEREATTEFIAKWFALLETLLPSYLAEGKAHLVIALGCTGGMHRSVALAEETAAFLGSKGYQVAVSHRDINKDRASR